MQTRKNIMELAQEVDNMKHNKHDYLVNAKTAEMMYDGKMAFPSIPSAFFNVGNVAHEQLSAKLDIPKKYYDRMKNEYPELLSANVNHWLSESQDRLMIRTLNKTDSREVRAVLSDRYLPLDNDIVLETLFPILMEHKDFTIISSEITEKRMYVCATSNRLMGEVKKGDVVQQGVIISNSEVGLGAIRIEPMLYILKCLNGAIMANALKKNHVGKKMQEEEYDIYSRETIMVDQHSFLLRARDTLINCFDELAFQQMLENISITTDNKIAQDTNLQRFIGEVTDRYNLSKKENDSVLFNLLKNGDLTQWGVSNSVTEISNEMLDFDRAVELQRIGGKILSLPYKEWEKLNL